MLPVFEVCLNSSGSLTQNILKLCVPQRGPMYQPCTLVEMTSSVYGEGQFNTIKQAANKVSVLKKNLWYTCQSSRCASINLQLSDSKIKELAVGFGREEQANYTHHQESDMVYKHRHLGKKGEGMPFLSLWVAHRSFFLVLWKAF